MRSLILFVLALMVTTCKTASKSSEVQSLGGVAGDTTLQTCKANPTSSFLEKYDTFWSQGSIVAAVGYKESLRNIFAAVPEGLQEWFFTKGGKVQLMGEAEQWCKVNGEMKSDMTPLLRNDGTLGGCVQTKEVSSKREFPQIFVSVTATDASGQYEQASMLVQAFAAVTATFLTDIGSNYDQANGSIIYSFGTQDQLLSTKKIELAFAAIDDLVKYKKQEKKEKAEIFPAAIADLLKRSNVLNTTLDRKVRMDAFSKEFANQDHRDFVNIIFTQTLESAWCNDTTRAEIADGGNSIFQETGRYFRASLEQELNASFDAVPSRAVAVSAITTQNSGNVSATVSKNSSNVILFPRMRAVLSAPVAVASYFVKNKPVRTWVATYKPLKRVALFVGNSAVAAGGAVVTGVRRVGWRVQNRCLIRRWNC